MKNKDWSIPPKADKTYLPLTQNEKDFLNDHSFPAYWWKFYCFSSFRSIAHNLISKGVLEVREFRNSDKKFMNSLDENDVLDYKYKNTFILGLIKKFNPKSLSENCSQDLKSYIEFLENFKHNPLARGSVYNSTYGDYQRIVNQPIHDKLSLLDNKICKAVYYNDFKFWFGVYEISTSPHSLNLHTDGSPHKALIEERHEARILDLKEYYDLLF